MEKKHKPNAPASAAPRGGGVRLLAVVSKFVLIFIGMSGLRLDIGNPFKNPDTRKRLLLWSALWIGSAIAYQLTFDPQFRIERPSSTLKFLAVAYIITTWTVYYVGNSVILGSDYKSILISKIGPQRANHIYEIFIGVVFFHQGLSQGAIFAVYSNTFPASFGAEWSTLLGIIFIVVGSGSKIWAVWLVGIDTYYYKDMFLAEHMPRSSTENYVKKGIYRYFKNPMYGIGNLHGYGVALMYRSVEGLACALAFQASIYIFYYFIELRFIKTFYEDQTQQTA